MGMDGVELVMAFEEEFGISIPDSAASQMLTPRQVIDFVVEQRRRVAQIDAQAHVNRILRELGCAPAGPDSAFDEMFHAKGRIRQWKELCKRLEPFTAPPARTKGSGCVVAGFGVIGLIISLFLREWILAGAGTVMVIAGFVWSQTTMSIPEHTNTVQKLVGHLTRPVSEQEVAAKVKSIVLEQLGLPEASYGEDKRFIEDFGID